LDTIKSVYKSENLVKERFLNYIWMSIKNYLDLLRVEQYVKNLFIFLPLFFALKITSIDLLVNNLIAFLCFSLLASAVYILNDYKDIEEDRRHPIKKNRPLAAGIISYKKALFIMALFAIISLSISYYVEINLFLVLLAYFAVNISYSFGLKHFPIIDLFIISGGFVFRILAGAEASGVEASMWIILMIFLLALFLGLSKRRDDILLSMNGQNTRKNIDGYNLEFVNAGMIIMAPVILVSYISYTVSPQIIEQFHTKYLYLTVLFVILGILRYMQITFVENNSGNPTKILLTDRFIQIAIIAWLVTFVILIY
jgi:decaprenyl-phosphate phosphoribosyltransferase